MVIRSLLKPALLLTLLFAVCIGLIRAQPYDDTELRAFLTPPDSCPMPCFMGIRPGVTTADDAVAILEAHEWANEVSVSIHDQTGQPTHVGWTWSGRQPTLIADTDLVNGFPQRGVLQIANEIVTAITIPTAISLGDFWVLWGAADEITFTTVMGVNADDPVGLIYNGLHAEHLAWIGTSTYCPYFPEFWKSKAILELVNNAENDRALFLEQSPVIRPYVQLAADLRHRQC